MFNQQNHSSRMMAGCGSNYCPGIGMPPYLLDRTDNDSGIYSQDASIVNDSSRSTTLMSDTSSLTSVSSYNLISGSSWSMNTQISARSNSSTSRIRENQSTHRDISSSVSAVQSTTQNSTSASSFLIGFFDAGSNRTQQNNEIFSGGAELSQLPPGYTNPADMFTPYVSLFTIDEEEPGRKQPSPGQ